MLVHNVDHFRRGGDSVNADVAAAGSMAVVVEVAVVVLAYQRHRWAPAAAIAAGFPLALGYVVTHALPERSWLSDPLFDGEAAAVSRFAAGLEIIAALILGGVGLVAYRRPWTARQLSLGVALRHPVVVLMVVGNLVILAGVFATQ